MNFYSIDVLLLKMKLQNQNLLIFPTLLTFNWLTNYCLAWQAKLYTDYHRSGKNSLFVYGYGTGSCQNLEDKQFCSSSNCSHGNAKSLDTMGSCIRLYEYGDCDGRPLIELRPGTVCHENLGNCDLVGKPKSIGGCPSYSGNFGLWQFLILKVSAAQNEICTG